MINNIIIAIFVSFVSFAAFAQERDPFMPYVYEAPAAVAEVTNPKKEIVGNNNPLTNKPLSTYRVVGLIIAPEDALVVIRGNDKREYFAYIGDSLGNDGGIIQSINSEGITVNNGEDIVNIDVNNNFEIQNEIEIE